MTAHETVSEGFRRIQRIALAVGLAASLAVAAGAVLDLEQFHRSWLLAFLFWLALPLGSMALVMLHHLTGGSWGFAIRRLLEGAMRTMPAMALAFLPVALGVHAIYEWSHEDVVAADPILQKKSAYLNEGFFLLRSAFYLALWALLALVLVRLSARADRTADPRLTRRMRALSGPGLALYGVTMTFAAVDWAMSLEPHWFSTIYGMIFVTGQGLTTLAFAVLMSSWLARRAPFSRWLSLDHFHDLGKLLFAFVMLWAYLTYSQFLIVWSANLSEETPWYLHRSSGGWQAVVLALVALHFALPFALLLSRRLKRSPRALANVALAILVMRLVDLIWLVVPAFHHDGPALHWMDLLAPIALGGLWLAYYISRLKGRPLISLQDARMLETLERPPGVEERTA